MLLKHPKIITQTITSRIVARLRQTNSGTPIRVPATSSFAVIPAGDEVPLHDFCESLARSLARFGRTLHVTSGSLDGHLGKQNISHTPPEDLDNLRIVQWLGRAELDHRYLVYEADARFSNWNRRCLRQADQVLIVGASGADPRPGLVEKQVMSDEFAGPGVSLVLLHRMDGMPSATVKWLEARKVDRHYHVRLGSDPDVDRLARFLTGRALGLALGGGFARGLAHVGVFRALDDLGIPVDAVGGSSMGAVIGAQWAQAWDYERMIRETSSECVGALNDLTFPFIAFHGGGKFSGAIRKFTGDTQIEDLRFPFFCVSANLNRAEMKVHTQGSLMKAVLASTRAPGIFPPIVYDGELHVDGGVLNNVPVDLVKRFCRGGTVFGVDVSPPHELNPIQDYGIEMSGWEAFRRRFGRFGRAKTYVPSILLIMMRTIEFGGVSYKKLIADSSDLYLQPPLLQFKRTDFALAPQIVDVSHRYARERIEGWLSRGAAPG
jgi:NTE family protein/lysophospholipid hydrolase